jgi:hypothetical protein
MLTPIRNYFSEKGSPFNIAIFRILFFALVFAFLKTQRPVWFSHMPSELFVAPVGMRHVLSIVPITPDLVFRMKILFMVFCFLAMVGFCARTSSFLAAISGIYILGIPQFYGKVEHFNHLIWFMLILSASRCADVLSVDAIWKAVREANQGKMSIIRDSVVYALPLRLIWLLMGIIYFFPGFWKFFRSQWAWAFSDNLKYEMYINWYIYGGQLPLFRLDQYPCLYKICALATIGFELSFIFLIFFPFLRPIAAVMGILFHAMIKYLMKIDFFTLQFCYVSFVNWAWLFSRLGRWIFPKPFHINFDGKPPSYLRRMAVLAKFDIFQRLVILNDAQAPRPEIRQKLLKLTGAVLLLTNSVFGFSRIIEGWPFACYPTFDTSLTKPAIETIVPYGVIGEKEERISLQNLYGSIHHARLYAMMNIILSVPDRGRRMVKLKAFVSVMKRAKIDLSRYSKVRFYKTIYWTQPEKTNAPAVLKMLLAEIDA